MRLSQISLALTAPRRSGASANSATDWYFASLGLAGTPWADVSRTGLGTRVDSAGLVGFGPHNLLLHSNNLANAVWTSTLGASSTATTVTIGTGATSEVRQTVAVATAGQTFTVQAKVSVASGTRLFRFKNTHGGVVDNFSANFTATTTPTLFTYTVTNSASPGEGAQIFGVVNASDASSNGATFTVTDLQINVGAATPYVPTTTAARYLPRITHDPVLDVNGNPYTVTEQYGPELVADPGFNNPAAWSPQTGWSISGGAASVNSSAAGSTYIRTAATVAGRTYLVTFTVTSYTSGTLRAAAGTAFSATGFTGTGTFTAFVVADGTQGVGVFAASTNTVATIDNISVQEYLGTVTTGTPRPLGLLVEGQGTNLFSRTDDLSVSAWALQGATVQGTRVTGPDGALSAQRFTPTINDAAITQDRVPASVVAFTYSVWLRSASGSNFDIALRLIRDSPFATVASKTITVTAEWQRFVFTATPLDTTNHRWRIGSGSVWGLGEVLDVWGPQLETGSVATSYIPNPGTGTAVRVADDWFLSGAAFSNIYNPAEGTLFIACTLSNIPSLARLMEITGATPGTHRMLVYTSSTQILFQVRDSTDQAVLVAALPAAANAEMRIGVTYKANEFRISVNGSAVVEDTAGSVPTGMNSLSIGWAQSGASDRAAQTAIRAARYIPSALSAAALQALTA